MGAGGHTVKVFTLYDDRDVPEDGRLWVEVDTSDESARQTAEGMRYRIGTDWLTAEELEALGITPVVVSFGRHAPAPDQLQP